jgi:hypothetical protein
MRRSLFLAGFAVSAAVLLGALAWISHLTVDLEAREQDARQRAAFEERVRLSLWRMDSAVASLLAQENARPVEPVEPFEPVEPAAPAPPEPPAPPAPPGRAASGPPPLAETNRPYLAARFEVGPGGEVREWPTVRRGQGRVAAPLERDALLAGLRQGPLVARPLPTSETGEPPHRSGAAAAATPQQPVRRPGTAAPAPLRKEQASGTVQPAGASGALLKVKAPALKQAAQPASTARLAESPRMEAAPSPGTAAGSQNAQLKAVQPAGASGALLKVKAPAPKQAAPAPEDEPPPAPPREARPEARAAPATDPVAREMAKQQQLNQTEFEQRLIQNQAYEPQAAEPPTRAGGKAAAGESPGAAAAPSATQAKTSSPAATASPTVPSASSPPSASSLPPASSLPSASPAPLASSAPSTGAPPAAAVSARPNLAASRPPSRPPRPRRSSGQASPRRRPAGGAGSAPPGRALGTVAAVWIGDDLILARRVARGGEELLQGARLDGLGTRAWLTAQVGDLLPRAALFPLRPGETADPGRRLALLPLRLDAGPLPAAPAAAGSPVRLGLAVAFAAVLLSLAAAGLQLAAAQRLARRRAAWTASRSRASCRTWRTTPASTDGTRQTPGST